MNFEDYLAGKKIDSAAFKTNLPEQWEDWRKQFEQMSPASFTAQKLYLINPLRRKYKLIDVEHKGQAPVEDAPAAVPAKPASKPVFKPKIK